MSLGRIFITTLDFSYSIIYWHNILQQVYTCCKMLFEPWGMASIRQEYGFKIFYFSIIGVYVVQDHVLVGKKVTLKSMTSKKRLSSNEKIVTLSRNYSISSTEVYLQLHLKVNKHQTLLRSFTNKTFYILFTIFRAKLLQNKSLKLIPILFKLKEI